MHGQRRATAEPAVVRATSVPVGSCSVRCELSYVFCCTLATPKLCGGKHVFPYVLSCRPYTGTCTDTPLLNSCAVPSASQLEAKSVRSLSL